MRKKVIKSGGKKEYFDIKKIDRTIKNAGADIGLEACYMRKYTELAFEAIRKMIADRDEISTKDIDRAVFKVLNSSNKEIAKAWRSCCKEK